MKINYLHAGPLGTMRLFAANPTFNLSNKLTITVARKMFWQCSFPPMGPAVQIMISSPDFRSTSGHHSLYPLGFTLKMQLSSCPEAFRTLTATFDLYQADKTWFSSKVPADFWASLSNAWLHCEACQGVAAPELPCHRNRTPLPNTKYSLGIFRSTFLHGTNNPCSKNPVPGKNMHIYIEKKSSCKKKCL